MTARSWPCTCGSARLGCISSAVRLTWCLTGAGRGVASPLCRTIPGMATYNLRAGLTPANVGVIFVDSLRTLDLNRQFTESSAMYAPDADTFAVRVLDGMIGTALTKIADDPTANEARYLTPLLALVPFTPVTGQTTARRSDGVFEGNAAPFDDLHGGAYTPTFPPFGTTSVLGLTANRAYYNRFVLPRGRTITGIAFFQVTPSGSNDNVDVGIYSATGVALSRSGATAGFLNTTGLKVVPITPVVALAKTVYYAGMSQQTPGTTNGGAFSRSMVVADGWRQFGTTLPLVDAEIQTSAHPLPSTITPDGTSTTIMPGLIVRWA